MLSTMTNPQSMLTFLEPTRRTFVVFVVIRLMAIWIVLGLTVGLLG